MKPSPSRREDPPLETAANLTRRGFLGSTLAAAAAVPTVGAMAADAPTPQSSKTPGITRKFKIGLVGCGSRGHWITSFFKRHGGYEFHAVADYFQEAADRTGNALGVDKSRRFSGRSGYRRLIDSGVEALVIEDVPYFYPEQAKAAVEAGCHVYMAKPIAVDVPGCLAIGELAKQATQKKRCFLIDYQLPTQPAAIEVANRVRAGGLGRLGNILSYGFGGGLADPPKGPTVDSRFLRRAWYSDIVFGGDVVLFYDIHIVDGVIWVVGERPVSACGRSRICRPTPHGDRTDCANMVFEFDDGTLWTHVVHALNDNPDLPSLSATFYGTEAIAHLQYGGKVYVRGGAKHYVGQIGSIYDDGVVRNVAQFYSSLTEGHFENPTVQRAVDGTLAGILGREAAARRCYLSLEQLVQENKKLEVDLTSLKA